MYFNLLAWAFPMINKIRLPWLSFTLAICSGLSNRPVIAQTIPAAPAAPLAQAVRPTPPPQDVNPVPNPPAPLPALPPQLPGPGELLQPGTPAPPTPELAPPNSPETITVERFNVVGSTVFSQADFANITQNYTKRPISLAELYEVRSKITDLYVKSGYITSGAYIPPQALTGGVVKIQISERGLEDIKVTGSRHLNPNYVRSRLAIATRKPLNQKRLLEALQLLQLNPLIKSVAAELSAGTKPSENLLTVNVTETPRWNFQTNLDNGRTPSVGTFRRQFQISNADLLGLGDSLSLGYTNTAGSNSFDASYTIPFNPRNGTIALSGGFASSRVIEQPFNVLDINSHSNYVELTVRQPIVQTPTQELALGLTVSHRESGATLLGGEIPFPSPGADDQGKTRVTALRFFQEYTRRNSAEVLAFRSQFNFGLNALNSTINETSPDSHFLVWRGQAQYVRRLAADSILLLRGDIQLADRPLLPLEQFGLGGQDSVRGYRQDQLLTDSGVFASAEARIPILRLPKLDNTVLQLAPFIDVGHGFNQSGSTATPNTLVSAGLGLRLQVGNRLTARFDWGIPLTQVSGDRGTLQEQGLYFSLTYNQPFKVISSKELISAMPMFQL